MFNSTVDGVLYMSKSTPFHSGWTRLRSVKWRYHNRRKNSETTLILHPHLIMMVVINAGAAIPSFWSCPTPHLITSFIFILLLRSTLLCLFLSSSLEGAPLRLSVSLHLYCLHVRVGIESRPGPHHWLPAVGTMELNSMIYPSPNFSTQPSVWVFWEEAHPFDSIVRRLPLSEVFSIGSHSPA